MWVEKLNLFEALSEDAKLEVREGPRNRHWKNANNGASESGLMCDIVWHQMGINPLDSNPGRNVLEPIVVVIAE